jgi:hypothetical protein
MRRTRLVSVVAVVALLGLAACGDDDGGEGGGSSDDLTTEEQAFADAWAKVLSDTDDDGFVFAEDDAQCMGEAIMAEIGTAPFDDAGLEPADVGGEDDGDDDSPGELLGTGTISDDQATAILDVWDGCTDLNAAFVELLAAGADLDDEAQSCIEDRLDDDDLVRAGFMASLTSEDSEPPPEVATALVTVVGTCGGDGSGQGGLIVDSIAESLAADGRLDETQSQCMAQAMVDAIGMDRLVELGVSGSGLDDAGADEQQELAGAVLEAAEACDVPLSTLGG